MEKAEDEAVEENEEVTENQILNALKNVEDPDLGKDIVSLGFVDDVRICGGQVGFTINLTTPACPVKDKMKNEAKEYVGMLPGVETVNVELDSQTRGRDGGAQPTGASTDGKQKKKKGEKQEEPESLKDIKNIVAVASGKGGVGKSTVAANIALSLAEDGADVGLMDADLYGPSIPKMFGIEDEKPGATSEERIVPIEKFGIQTISIGVLQNEEPDAPTIWRGPIATNMIKQFLGGVHWGELEYLIIDLPPGTGDIQLTLTQGAPLTGGVIVTTPQEVSLIDARKGLKMFQKVNVPILGLVENMSQFVCPNCDEVHHIFRQGGGGKVADEFDVPLLGEVPINPSIAEGMDEGQPFFKKDPDSPSSEAFLDVARNMAARLSTLHMSDEAQETETFSIDWEADDKR